MERDEDGTRALLAPRIDDSWRHPMSVIGVVADTHGVLRPEALSALAGVEHILHAGDIGRADIIPRLTEIAPVTAIRGNVDRGDWARPYPETMSLYLAGRRIFLIHDGNDLRFDPAREGYDIVVSGHSHRPSAKTVDGVLHLNPGSAGPRRFSLPVTVAILRLQHGAIAASIRDLL